MKQRVWSNATFRSTKWLLFGQDLVLGIYRRLGLVKRKFVCISPTSSWTPSHCLRSTSRQTCKPLPQQWVCACARLTQKAGGAAHIVLAANARQDQEWSLHCSKGRGCAHSRNKLKNFRAAFREGTLGEVKR